jgi:hypothetical protein
MAHAPACRSSGRREPGQAGPSCRDVARRGQQNIRQAPAHLRDQATRFYAEVIDLCQVPGLAQRARRCLAAAADLAAARGCPSLPATADTLQDTGGNAEVSPSCAEIVSRALRVLAREPDAPVSPTARMEEEELFMDDCAATTPQGRRCAAVAITVDAIDECLAQRPSLDDDVLDLAPAPPP